MNKKLFLSLWITLFVIRHGGSGDIAIRFDGMTQQQVIDMYSLTGNTVDFVDQATYDSFQLAHQLIPPTTSQMLTAAKAQASQAVITGPDAVSELQRAILLTILDQINTIRAALPTPLSAITPAQAKTAVQNKLNSGAAD